MSLKTSVTSLKSLTATAALVLLMFFAYSGYQPDNSGFGFFSEYINTGHKLIDPKPPIPIRSLLKALGKAIQAAATRRSGESVLSGFTTAQRRDWNKKNPCRSRLELNAQYRQRRRRTGNVIATPGHLNTILQEYETLHRTCIQKAGNLTQLFLTKNDSTGCKFLVGKGGNGIGNRVLWIISTLLYAILTQRVILIDPRFLIPSIMCEPFPGSSWAAPPDFPFMDIRRDLWVTSDEFLTEAEAAFQGGTSTPAVYAAQADNDWGPHSRFYCNTEQYLYDNVTWVSLGGCLYFLPQLFAISKFNAVLEALFPDKVPLTPLLRYAMLPIDSLWARVRRVQETYLQAADHIVGIQMRYMGGAQEYNELHDVVNARILECAIENKILPNVTEHMELKGSPVTGQDFPAKHSTPHTVVFVASLYGGLRDALSRLYPLQPTSTGELVGVVQLTQEGGQHAPAIEDDSEALVEILCLSLSDSIFTTPASTYSELAQAYGGLMPYLVNHRSQSWKKGCVRGQAIDGCYQGAPVSYDCPFDADVNGQRVRDFVKSLRPCQTDVSGLQLVGS